MNTVMIFCFCIYLSFLLNWMLRIKAKNKLYREKIIEKIDGLIEGKECIPSEKQELELMNHSNILSTFVTLFIVMIFGLFKMTKADLPLFLYFFWGFEVAFIVWFNICNIKIYKLLKRFQR